MTQQLVEGETNPSGVQGEAECPSEHIESDVKDVPCTSCGGQV